MVDEEDELDGEEEETPQEDLGALWAEGGKREGRRQRYAQQARERAQRAQGRAIGREALRRVRLGRPLRRRPLIDPATKKPIEVGGAWDQAIAKQEAGQGQPQEAGQGQAGGNEQIARLNSKVEEILEKIRTLGEQMTALKTSVDDVSHKVDIMGVFTT